MVLVGESFGILGHHERTWRRDGPQDRPGAAAMKPSRSGVGSVPEKTSGDASCWREAARLRREHRGWIVIWLAREGCYKAYKRMPGAPRDTALSGATADQMAEQIRRAEQAKARPARHATDPA